MGKEQYKIFEGYVVLHWKNKTMRLSVRKPRNVGPYDIPIRLHVKVRVPEIKEIVAKGDIEIPENKVGDIIIENI